MTYKGIFSLPVAERGWERKVRLPCMCSWSGVYSEVDFIVTEAIVTWWCCGSMAVFFQLFHITTSQMQSVNLLQQTQISKVQIKTIISKVPLAWSQPTARHSGLRKSYSLCQCIVGAWWTAYRMDTVRFQVLNVKKKYKKMMKQVIWNQELKV